MDDTPKGSSNSQPQLEASTALSSPSTPPDQKAEIPLENDGIQPHKYRSITRKILALAIPALGSLIAEPLFTFIDSAMVGNLGTQQLAGLSVASQILQTVVVLFVFLAYSTTSLTARALGSGDRARAFAQGMNATILALGLGILSTVAVIASAKPLVGLLTQDPEVSHQATMYLIASAPSLIGTLVGFAVVGMLRGLQDTRTPLIVTAVGTLVNIALNATLMYGFKLGVAGSGIGTSVSLIGMASVYVAILYSHARAEKITLRPDASGIAHAAIEGAPLIVRGVALRIAGLATIWPVSHLGASEVASYQVVLTIWTLASFILDSLAIASQSLVGFAVGKGSASELRELLKVLTIWGLGVGFILTVLIAFLSPWLPLAFGSDPMMHELAKWGLAASVLGFPFCGVVFMLDGVLLGAGDNMFFAIAGPLQLAVLLPALGAVEYLRQAGVASSIIVVGVWLAYALVYLGARFASNIWRTWFSKGGLLRSMPATS